MPPNWEKSAVFGDSMIVFNAESTNAHASQMGHRNYTDGCLRIPKKFPDRRIALFTTEAIHMKSEPNKIPPISIARAQLQRNRMLTVYVSHKKKNAGNDIRERTKYEEIATNVLL